MAWNVAGWSCFATTSAAIRLPTWTDRTLEFQHRRSSHSWLTQVTLAASKHLWDWLSHGVYSSSSDFKWVDSCNSSELYSALAEWMKGAVAASSPHSPFGGLGRKGETRAPTKLLGDCPVTDSQCSRIIFLGNDSSHCELLICVLHAHKSWCNRLLQR